MGLCFIFFSPVKLWRQQSSCKWFQTPMRYNHCNEKVVISTKFSSLAVLKVVEITFNVAIEDNFIEMAKFPFQWYFITPPQCIKPYHAIVDAKSYISCVEASGSCLMCSSRQLEKNHSYLCCSFMPKTYCDPIGPIFVVKCICDISKPFRVRKSNQGCRRTHPRPWYGWYLSAIDAYQYICLLFTTNRWIKGAAVSTRPHSWLCCLDVVMFCCSNRQKLVVTIILIFYFIKFVGFKEWLRYRICSLCNIEFLSCTWLS